MKKCSYCGKEYPDDVAECLIDGQPVNSESPTSAEKQMPAYQMRAWMRYPAAILIAFIASVVTALILTLFAVPLSRAIGSSPILSSVVGSSFSLLPGFSGVFFGTFCFQQRRRVFGALLLLVLGVYFEIWIFGFAHGGFHFPSGTVFTGIGGLAAVTFHYWRSRQTIS